MCVSMGPEQTHTHTHEKSAYSMEGGGDGEGIHPRGQTSRSREEKSGEKRESKCPSTAGCIINSAHERSQLRVQLYTA